MRIGPDLLECRTENHDLSRVQVVGEVLWHVADVRMENRALVTWREIGSERTYETARQTAEVTKEATKLTRECEPPRLSEVDG